MLSLAEAFSSLSADDRLSLVREACDTKIENSVVAKIRDVINVKAGRRIAFRCASPSRLSLENPRGIKRMHGIDLIVERSRGLHLWEFKQYYDFDCIRALGGTFACVERDIANDMRRIRGLKKANPCRIVGAHTVALIVRLGIELMNGAGGSFIYSPSQNAARALVEIGKANHEDPVRFYMVKQLPKHHSKEIPPPDCTGELKLGELHDGKRLIAPSLFWATYPA
jgi:hypothetical protein